MDGTEVPRLHHSLQAEQNVLGSVLRGGIEVLSEVMDLITTDDFYRVDHSIIYTNMRCMDDANREIDIITLSEYLKEQGCLKEAGGLAYLGTLVKDTATVSNVRDYAKIVRDRAIRRKLSHTAYQVAATSDEDGDVDEILSKAQAQILDIGKETISTGPVMIGDIIGPWLDKLDQKAQAEEKLAGLSTGYPDIDRKIGGLEAGNLIIIAGRPSMGKTAIAINIVNNIGFKYATPSLVFSMEMTNDEIMTRLVSQNAHVETERLRTGDISNEHWTKVNGALQQIKLNERVLVDDTPGITLAQIRSRSRRVKQKHGLALIVIDYLQLMGTGLQGDTRAEKLGEITRGLKGLAKELSVPVICLSQLNRDVEKRQDRRPMLSDLKESGSIEQDADLVIFIYREVVYNPAVIHPKVAEVIIGKQRNGPTGVVLMHFFDVYTLFAQMDMGSQQEFWNAKQTNKTRRPQGLEA